MVLAGLVLLAVSPATPARTATRTTPSAYPVLALAAVALRVPAIVQPLRHTQLLPPPAPAPPLAPFPPAFPFAPFTSFVAFAVVPDVEDPDEPVFHGAKIGVPYFNFTLSRTSGAGGGKRVVRAYTFGYISQ